MRTSAGNATTHFRVLIADDNADEAESLAILVGLWGYRGHAVYSGRDAIHAVDTFQPDAVLLDLGMPGLDGCAVAQHVRRNDRFGKALVVAVTAHGSDEIRHRCREAGFDLHLAKPVDLALLRWTLAIARRSGPLSAPQETADDNRALLVRVAGLQDRRREARVGRFYVN